MAGGPGGGKMPPPSNAALPRLIGSARATTAPSRPVSLGTGARFWGYRPSEPLRGATPRLQTGSPHGPMSPRSPEMPGTRCSTAPTPSTAGDARPKDSVQRLMDWIEKELEIQGLGGSPPSVDRVRIFSCALGEVIEMLPSYRPFLLSLQREYDGLVSRLQVDLHNLAPLEGRLKTLKAESLSFVGQSMTWFQMEIACLKKRLEEAEADRERLAEENEVLKEEKVRLTESSDKDKYQASESHLQNLDILQYLDRMEKTVEGLRKQERDLSNDNKTLEKNLKNKEDRMAAAEKQLEAERKKNETMVTVEDHEALKDEIRHLKESEAKLEEKLDIKEKDYLRIVEIYQNSIGQDSGHSVDAGRPLTPRPTWHHCKGMLDPGSSRSVEQAEYSQELMQHILVKSRTILSAYGLASASAKSPLLASYSKHRMVLPLVAPDPREKKGRSGTKETEEHDSRPASAAPDKEGDKDKPKAFQLEEEPELAPDTDMDTPEPLRHADPVKNLRLSRKKTADILESVLSMRYRSGGSLLSLPFVEVMLEHLPADIPEEERIEFGVNLYASVRRYSQEPDFLAYLLLLQGRISDTIVRDNRNLCSEILRVIVAVDKGDGKPHDARHVSKQDFFFGLKDVLPHKDQELRNQLVNCLPAGQADAQLNLEWLLSDDTYVLSPIVYALRLQHLQEALDLADRLMAVIKKCPIKGGKVRYEDIEAQCRDHAEFGVLEAEDFAKGFGVHEEDLVPECEQQYEKLLQLLMTHTDLFNSMLFPREDDGAGGQ